MRVAVREVRVQPDDLEELLDAFLLLLARGEVVHLDRLADDVANRHPRIQARVRVLEDHLHLATHPAKLLATERRELGPGEAHGSRRRLVELQDRAAGRRLAAAGFPDEAERLALFDEERDAVDGAHGADLALEEDALREREVHHEVLDLDERLAVGARDVPRVRRPRHGLHGHLVTPSPPEERARRPRARGWPPAGARPAAA